MAQRDEGFTRVSGTAGFRLTGWAAVLFAAALYAVPSPTAEQTQRTSLDFKGIWEALSLHAWPALMEAAPYLPAALALIAVLALFLRHLKRRRLRLAVLRDATGAALRELPRKDFKRLVSRGFRRQGYRMVHRRSDAPEDKVDLELTKDGERFLVQYRHWQEWQVGVEAVQELHELIPETAADGAFIVISGEFTHAAERFAQGKKVQLVDVHRLREMLCRHGKPEFRLGPRQRTQHPGKRLPIAGLAAAAIGSLAIGGALWWFGPSSSLGPRPPLVVQPVPAAPTLTVHAFPAGAQPERAEAYRARTPVLPAEIRMDFPKPGEVRSAKRHPRVVERDKDARRERRAEALEADFELEYQPPADCDNWRSMEHMVACGNHRIRAWKEYQAKHWALGRIDTARAEVRTPE
jgi:restriction system protein